MSDARDRFVHLAEARTTKAIKMIRLIGNLSNTSNYSYSEKDIAMIFGAIDEEVKAARRRFSEARRPTKDVDFSLES